MCELEPKNVSFALYRPTGVATQVCLDIASSIFMTILCSSGTKTDRFRARFGLDVWMSQINDDELLLLWSLLQILLLTWCRTIQLLYLSLTLSSTVFRVEVQLCLELNRTIYSNRSSFVGRMHFKSFYSSCQLCWYISWRSNISEKFTY